MTHCRNRLNVNDTSCCLVGMSYQGFLYHSGCTLVKTIKDLLTSQMNIKTNVFFSNMELYSAVNKVNGNNKQI